MARLKAIPVKRKNLATTQRTAEGYVRRPSQITRGKPTKRLVNRRIKNLRVPMGVFPNPSPRNIYYAVKAYGYTGFPRFNDSLKTLTQARKIAKEYLKEGFHSYEIYKDLPRKTGYFGIERELVESFGPEADAPTKTNPSPREIDEVYAREIFLFGQNDGDLYRSRTTPIIDNLAKKYVKGTYDKALARKLWRYWADDAAKRYAVEFLNQKTGFPVNVPTRELIAEMAEDEYFDHVKSEAPKFAPKSKPRKNPVARGVTKSPSSLEMKIRGKAYSVESSKTGNGAWNAEGIFLTAAKAKNYAQALAKSYPSIYFRVIEK